MINRPIYSIGLKNPKNPFISIENYVFKREIAAIKKKDKLNKEMGGYMKEKGMIYVVLVTNDWKIL